MALDRDRDKLVHRVLGDPDRYPDELQSWVRRILEDNPTFKLASYQLPTVEGTSYVGQESEPPFLPAWVNYGPGNEAAGFYKDPFGRVFLTGLVKDGTPGTTIFQLPGGYRPKLREQFAVSTGTAEAHGRVDVTSAGDVIHVSGPVNYVSLSGISFRSFG